jgi:hypothetical protein
MSTGHVFVIKTDLPPELVTEIGVEIFVKWMNFALGKDMLNGKRLFYPSGRYASSLSFRQVDENTVAILADESVAPEALFLEEGHRSFDMKTVAALRGRSIPIHRPVGSAQHLSMTGLKRVGGGPARPMMWAEVRAGTSSGFASIGPNSPADSWIIPSMPAYSPAGTLAAMARGMAQGLV